MPKKDVLESERCSRSFKNSKFLKVFQQALNMTFIEQYVSASSLLADFQFQLKRVSICYGIHKVCNVTKKQIPEEICSMVFIMEKSFYHNFYYGIEKQIFQSTFEWLFSLKHCRISGKNHCTLTQTFLIHYVRLKKLLEIGRKRFLVGRFMQASAPKLYSKIVPPRISFQVFLSEAQN